MTLNACSYNVNVLREDSAAHLQKPAVQSASESWAEAGCWKPINPLLLLPLGRVASKSCSAVETSLKNECIWWQSVALMLLILGCGISCSREDLGVAELP